MFLDLFITLYKEGNSFAPTIQEGINPSIPQQSSSLLCAFSYSTLSPPLISCGRCMGWLTRSLEMVSWHRANLTPKSCELVGSWQGMLVRLERVSKYCMGQEARSRSVTDHSGIIWSLRYELWSPIHLTRVILGTQACLEGCSLTLQKVTNQ